MSAQAIEVQNAIEDVQKQFLIAFDQGDAAAIAALYTEDCQVMPPGSNIVKGKSGLEMLWRFVMAMGVAKAEMKTLELDPQGDTAIEMGRVTLYKASGEVIDSPKYLIVWKCVNGQWKLHRNIWNSDTMPEDE